MHGIRSVAKNLHFYMPRFFDEFFDQHRVIAKSGLCFMLCRGKCVGKFRRVFNAAHPTPAAACDGFDEDGKADVGRLFCEHIRALIRAMISRHNRNTRLFHQRFCGILKPHCADRPG